MARKFGKKNHVKVDPFNYSLMMLGEPKIGKTSLIYKVAEKQLGEDGYIFAEFYRERGADAIEGIVAENIPDWDTWVEFVDDIVENKTTDYKDLRLVVMDTYDQYILLAEKEAIKIWNRQNPDKRTDSLKKTWGGFNGPSDKSKELMFEQTDRLESVGVKVWWIGHCKLKEVKNIYDDSTYQTLTSDQQQVYFNSLKKNLHFLCLAYFDREIQKEKTGQKDLVTKKDKYKNIIKDESRKIKFRDDAYVVDSGSRFSNIVNEINLDADEFIKAINDAIKYEIESNGVNLDDRKIEDAKQDKEDAKKIEANVNEYKDSKALANVINDIVTFCVENKSNKNEIRVILSMCKENGYNNPKEIDNIDFANKVMEYIQSKQ